MGKDLFTYHVDIVFCVDCSESMGPLLERVKQQICRIPVDLKRIEERRDRELIIRTKIIIFRDYLDNSNPAMMMTPFFELPQQYSEFQEALECLEAKGGGIASSQDGLEAVAYAIRSTKWIESVMRERHVIWVFSDNPAHPIGYGSASANYPKGMVKNFDELTSWWGGRYAPGLMDEYAKRMILFTPDAPGWREIRNNWNKVVHYRSDEGDGLRECDYETLLSCICNDL